MNRKTPWPTPPVALQALILVVLFTSALYGVFVPYYATNDDNMRAMILRGVGFTQAPSEWTVYSNVLLGKLLAGLYRAWPSTAWYAGTLLLTIALALWTALTLLLPLARDARTRLLLALTLPTLFYPYFLYLQWTSVAELAASIGAFAIVASLDRDQSALPGWAGVLLLGLSALWRDSGMALGVLVALPHLLHVWHTSSGRWRDARPLLIGALAVVAIPWLVHQGILARNPEWSDALRYAQLRARYFHFVDIRYDDRTEPLFREIGWDRLDYRLFSTWYGGVGKFGLESLEKLHALRPDFSPRDWRVLRDTLALPSMVLQMSLLALMFLWVRRKGALAVIGQAAWTGAVLLFLFLRMWAPHRVAAPLVAYAVLAAVSIALGGSPAGPRPAPDPRRGWKTLSLLVLASLLGRALWQTDVMDRIFREREAGFRKAVAPLAERKDLLIVYWGNGIHTDWIRAFDDYRSLEGLNLYPVFWLASSPHAKAMRERFRLTDPVRDLVDRPDVLLAPSDILPWDLYREYMQVKYGMVVEARKVVDGMGCRVYRVVTDRSKAKDLR